jgi:DNA processing protein
LSDPELVAWAALAWGAGLGPVGFWRLVEAFGGVEAILRASADDLRAPALRLGSTQAVAIAGLGARLGAFAAEIERLAGRGVAVLREPDSAYPTLLRGLADRPPVLCMIGSVLPSDEPAIAIVGTRTPSEEGRRKAAELGEAFAEHGVTVVSGLARGCDGAAHEGALEAGGRTIAVLGSGITRIYPSEHRDLAERIAERGAVLSESPPGASPEASRLMARNRLISALAGGTIVVEAGSRGGALKTANEARRQGRWVYTASWAGRDQPSPGVGLLLGKGAQAIGGRGDVHEVVRQLAQGPEAGSKTVETGQSRLLDA